MRSTVLVDDDVQQLAEDRARALAAIDRVRKSAFGLPLEGVISRLIPSERERDALAEAAASLYAKRRARARAVARRSGE
jgi:hypothetical protein